MPDTSLRPSSSAPVSTTLEVQPKYVVISPVRDEGHLLEQMILSMVSQTLRPEQWVIVNDGSSDNTGLIIDDYAGKYPWITAAHRSDRGFRAPGSGVIEAFYQGCDLLKTSDWEFIVKLDGDLHLSPHYFQRCMAEFRADPKLGMGGGVVGHADGEAMRIEENPRFHVRGATKIYRRECWQAIGGLLKSPGWDTVDELKANMLGWTTRSFPHIPVLQKRPTGATNSTWGNWAKNGRANYVTGYHPLFMFLKCVRRSRHKPYLFTGLALLYGYLSGYALRLPRVEDKALIRYVRKQQMRRLLNRDSIWH
ncbi:MAG TPA: glycosyltransferase family A protein [Candidatus Cybelea sp.]|nr:glycosyltransferase family A protein [Candidatus Cybelea sp.]